MSDDAAGRQSEIAPIGLEKIDSERVLKIEWSDGVTQLIDFRTLRNACPCAHCVEKRMEEANLTRRPESDSNLNEPEGNDASSIPESPPNELPVLSAAEVRPPGVESMKPIGNYAYAIRFSDGHSSGIYSFEFLRSLASAQRE